MIVTSGGIGGNHDLVRKTWPARLGTPPKTMVAGVPAHVDGRMLGITEAAGARVINPDRMWHYVEGIRNWDPIWENHGIRILPGPSSLWLDATGKRLPAPYFPGFDTLGTLTHLRTTGYDYSWFVLTQKIIEKEFALSGSEQNPDLTGKDIKLLLSRVKKGAPGPIEAFKQHGEDFIVADNLTDLVKGMNEVGDKALDRRGRAARADRGARPRDRQHLHQGRAGHRDPRCPHLPRRQADPGRHPAQAARPEGRPAHRRTPQRADPQDARRPRDRPRRALPDLRRHPAAGALRRR